MKTVPAMLGTPRLFREFFILHLGLWSILCEKATKRNDEECPVQLTITRNSKQSARTGELFKIQCPVKYCVHRPNVTWCKHNGTICVPLEVSPQLYTSWEENQSVPVFVLHFKPIHLSDNGSYSCSTNFNSQVINSHSVTIHVTERTQNSSEHPLITVSDIPDATNASGPSTMEERPGRTWLLYTLLPLGALLLLLACVCLLCFLKRIQGKEKKPSDLAGRDTNLVDIPASSRTNHQALPSGTGIYDNDPWSSMQDESELTISLQSERNNQGIVYASLNHCVIGRNPRQENNMQEAPTEYASICVRS
ncbi:B- and T-lymphocyte attenuator isoform 1 precursor [Mus musculus]|uniref:B- and T-lymphocyte attenuator n=1 Tax=Mus musculus TaxID=10090 RepID=E9QNY6_MOUSE|nr:B- and T-lymphocyte attenuator isoform 1 precursor [Mus musculus]|eukprot:NP_001032808.2 B- and T-lymphocyte attenuator isoform 1 precursor [Mus musculus]